MYGSRRAFARVLDEPFVDACLVGHSQVLEHALGNSIWQVPARMPSSRGRNWLELVTQVVSSPNTHKDRKGKIRACYKHERNHSMTKAHLVHVTPAWACETIRSLGKTCSVRGKPDET